MAKYICGLLILFFSCASNYGIQEVELIEVKIKHKKFAKLIDSLVVVDKNCNYYKEGGHFNIYIREDETISFSYEDKSIIFKERLNQYFVYSSNHTNVIIYNLERFPEYFDKQNTKIIVKAYLPNVNKPPEMILFDNSDYAIREFYVKRDSIIYKMGYNICP